MKIQEKMNLHGGKKKAANVTLKAIVKGSGYTQRFLASTWGVSESFLSRVLAGKATSKPLQKKVRKLSILNDDYIKALTALNDRA